MSFEENLPEFYPTKWKNGETMVWKAGDYVDEEAVHSLLSKAGIPHKVEYIKKVIAGREIPQKCISVLGDYSDEAQGLMVRLELAYKEAARIKQTIYHPEDFIYERGEM